MSLEHYRVFKRLILVSIVFVCLAAYAQVYVDQINVDNIRLDGSTVSTTNTNGDLSLTPNGSGKVILSSGTASTVPYLDADKKIVSSAVTPTQLSYLDATSSIQTQLNTKAASADLTTHTSATDAHSATSANTASRIVLRDGSGNFSAGTITATLSGNASTATALAANPSDCAGGTYATTIDASGNLSCSSVSGSALAVNPESSAYTALTSDDVILASTASAWTLTLYTASGNTGKLIRVYKTSADKNLLTIDPNGAETIDGKANITLNMKNDSVTLMSDGTNWVKIAGSVDSPRVAAEGYMAGTANCTSLTRSSTTPGVVAADADCPGITVVSHDMATLATTDANLPRFSVSGLPDGKYVAEIEYSSTNSSGRVVHTVFDGSTSCAPAQASQDTSRIGQIARCTFTYTGVASGSSNAPVYDLYVANTDATNVTVYAGDTTPASNIKFKLTYMGNL
jgi:hypothetical protein